MAKQYTLTENDRSKIRGALDRVEVLSAQSREAPSSPASGVWVKLSSTSPTDGRYPGSWYWRDDGADTWREGGEAWIVDANAVGLATGKYYRAQLVRVGGDPAKPIFYTDRDATAAITVREQDGSPSVSASTITFDQADGFVVTNLGSGEAQVDQTPASLTTVGYVTIGAQTIRGPKTIDTNGAGTDALGFTDISGGFLELSGPADPGIVNRLCVMQINCDYYSMPTADQTYWRTLRNGTAWPCGIRFYDPYTSGTPSFGLLVSNGPYWMLDYSADTLTPPTVILNWTDLSSVQHTEEGQTGTFGGLEFVGGFLVGGSLSAPVTIGNTVSGATTNAILFSDGSGNLDDSGDFTFDDSAKTLTLGSGGYLVSSRATTPTLSVNSTLAGPYLKDF